MQNLFEIAIVIAIAFYLIGIWIIAYHLMRFGKTAELKTIKPYERVIIFLYRHWFVLFLQLFALGCVGLIPIGAYIVLPPTTLFAPVAIAYYALLLYAVMYSITMYLLDIWIVTDHRVIDSEQHGFFRRTTAEINLAKIQDISVSITGVIPTFLDFGDLEIQSAGASEKFFFKQIPNPNSVRDSIMEAHNEFIRAHPDDVEIHEP